MNSTAEDSRIRLFPKSTKGLVIIGVLVWCVAKFTTTFWTIPSLVLFGVLVLPSWALVYYRPRAFVGAYVLLTTTILLAVYLFHHLKSSPAYLYTNYQLPRGIIGSLMPALQLMGVGVFIAWSKVGHNAKVFLAMAVLAILTASVLTGEVIAYPTDNVLRKNYFIHHKEFQNLVFIVLSEIKDSLPELDVRVPKGPVKNVLWIYRYPQKSVNPNAVNMAKPDKLQKTLRSIGATQKDGSIMISSGLLQIVLTRGDSSIYSVEKGYLFGGKGRPSPGCQYKVLEKDWSLYRCANIELP